ncbi:hypothetical protein [Nonomuraea sp. JJY05]|uniref:hypothetical protein n=1 Tax=Nonomuraea sp. JJY05 TaxID=3350255 RepID=UPI00373F686E
MTRTNVTFLGGGIRIAAHLYTPDTPAAGPWPALVVGSPSPSTPPTKAKRLRQLLTGRDHHVRAVATVSTAEPARQCRLGADGTQDPAVFQSLLAAAAQARGTATRGEDPGAMTMFPDTAEQAGAHGIEASSTTAPPRRTRTFS